MQVNEAKSQQSTRSLSSRLIQIAGNVIAPKGVGEGRLCILNYHRVLPAADFLLSSDPDIDTFRWQMKLLADSFNVLPLPDAVEMLRTKRMPPRAVCITFDDGYRSTYSLALPVLKEFYLPATVFVTSGYVGQGNMWNDRIVEAVRHTRHTRIDLQHLGMGIHSVASEPDRIQTVEKLTQAAKYASSETRLQLAAVLELQAEMPPAGELMLSHDELRTLSREGIEIGAHTITHPILASIDDDEARNEIAGSKRQLEEMTGKPVRLFAYPNGKAGIDFDHRHVKMTREAGFMAALTSSIGAATRKNDLFEIPRTLPWDQSPLMFGTRILRWLAGKNT